MLGLAENFGPLKLIRQLVFLIKTMVGRAVIGDN
jgi:hypothetical protein